MCGGGEWGYTPQGASVEIREQPERVRSLLHMDSFSRWSPVLMPFPAEPLAASQFWLLLAAFNGVSFVRPGNLYVRAQVFFFALKVCGVGAKI